MIGLLFAPVLMVLWAAGLQGRGPIAAIFIRPPAMERLARIPLRRRALLFISPSVAFAVAIGATQLRRGAADVEVANWLGVWVLLSGIWAFTIARLAGRGR